MEIKLFSFQDKEVRTTLQGREVWFVAQDVFKVLNLTWGGKNSLSNRKIPENWALLKGSHTMGGLQDMLFINEQAVYKLTFKSKTPQADTFTNWVVELLVKIT